MKTGKQLLDIMGSWKMVSNEGQWTIKNKSVRQNKDKSWHLLLDNRAFFFQFLIGMSAKFLIKSRPTLQ